MNLAQPRKIYIEAWKTGLSVCPVCAEISLVNFTLWRPMPEGSVGYYDFSQWETWYKIGGKTATVVFVSNHDFSWSEAVSVAAEIVAGKWTRWTLDLSQI